MDIIVAAVSGGRWRPGIGDPTFVGWLTVFAYAVAAWSCWRTAWRERGRDGSAVAGPVRLWLALALGLLLLGVNKQLDLQTWMTEVGRDAVRAIGRYGQRRTYQLAFIAAVAASCVGLLGTLLYVARPLTQPRLWALVGACFLIGFVLIRACSFHNVDIFLAATIGRLRWNCVLELGGITTIAVAGWWARHEQRGPSKA